jgi:hypothetical protein
MTVNSDPSSALRKKTDRASAKLSVGRLFSSLYGLYTVVLQELKALLKTSNPADPTETPNPDPIQEDGFTEVRRRKRHSTNEAAPKTEKAAAVVEAAAVATPQNVTTRNYFVPLRATSMDTDFSGAEATTHEEAVPGKTSRSPLIILISMTNLFQLQKQLRNVVQGDSEFRSTRNGTGVITKCTVDFEVVKFHFNKNNLFYYSFFRCLKSS